MIEYRADSDKTKLYPRLPIYSVVGGNMYKHIYQRLNGVRWKILWLKTRIKKKSVKFSVGLLKGISVHPELLWLYV